MSAYAGSASAAFVIFASVVALNPVNAVAVTTRLVAGPVGPRHPARQARPSLTVISRS